MSHNSYKGWLLVQTGQNYYCACKGNLRVPVGSIKHGDRDALYRRFKEVVDGLEDS